AGEGWLQSPFLPPTAEECPPRLGVSPATAAAVRHTAPPTPPGCPPPGSAARAGRRSACRGGPGTLCPDGAVVRPGIRRASRRRCTSRWQQTAIVLPSLARGTCKPPCRPPPARRSGVGQTYPARPPVRSRAERRGPRG